MLLMLALLAVCSAAFILYQSWRGRALDTQPPVITVPSEPLELSVQDDPAQLLQGIRAYDAKDGDVTPSVVVESVYGAVAQRQFQVTYAAFDRAGNRLGFGGGYYDRFLAAFGARGSGRRPLLVGLCYAFQVVDALPSQDWDRPVDCLCTEEGLVCL